MTTSSPERRKLNIVIAGHVDHGKSTIVGRLLVDTNSLPQGKLAQVKATCAKTSKPFEYAFLIDALKDEQAQGITIDSSRVFFKTALRDYIIIDAPGHIEFLKNMITGAARAEAALLVIDAHEGVQENSRRHGYLLSMLGIRQIAVVVNKMDLVNYDRKTFEAIVAEYTRFLTQIGVTPACFIPVSGVQGDTITTLSPRMAWYKGLTVVAALDAFSEEKPPVEQPFRMPVQDVYKFTNFGDSRRIVAGTIATGTLAVGDEVVFFPSGKKSRVQSIEAFNAPPCTTITAGQAAGFTLAEQVYITRGELAAKANEARPKVTSRIRVSLFWLGREPMKKDTTYLLRLGTARVPVRLEEITNVIDASNLSSTGATDVIERHAVAECILKLQKAMAFDVTQDNAATSRFVIVDNYEISGGGIIREDLSDRQTWIRASLFQRDAKWETSAISHEDRAERYNQKATLIVITGGKDVGKKPLAKRLEARLFAEGKIAYFLGIASVLYGVDADLKEHQQNRREHLRRLAEVAHILLEVGIILIVTAIELTQEEMELIGAIVSPDRIETVWIGEQVTTGVEHDLKIPSAADLDRAVDMVKNLLQEKGIIFKPW